MRNAHDKNDTQVTGQTVQALQLGFLRCLLHHKGFMAMRELNANQVWHKAHWRLNVNRRELPFEPIGASKSGAPLL